MRLTARMPVRTERMSLADLIAQIKIAASREAQALQYQLVGSAVDPTLAVEVIPCC